MIRRNGMGVRIVTSVAAYGAVMLFCAGLAATLPFLTEAGQALIRLGGTLAVPGLIVCVFLARSWASVGLPITALAAGGAVLLVMAG